MKSFVMVLLIITFVNSNVTIEANAALDTLVVGKVRLDNFICLLKRQIS